MESTEHTNSRTEELEFLISIMNDLAHKYSNHNEKLLEELISILKYRKDREEITATAKSKSEEFQRNKQKRRAYHHA